MEWISEIQLAINYIEEHIMNEINYEDAAKSLHISCYEFHRAFSFLTGMTANAYIRSRRLSLAGREIVETDAKITDIALKYGYDTPESFTKAFTRFHGISPKTARDESAKLALVFEIVADLIVPTKSLCFLIRILLHLGIVIYLLSSENLIVLFGILLLVVYDCLLFLDLNFGNPAW